MVEIGIAEIKKINHILSETHGFGFAGYAQSSFKRRINRILSVHNFKTIDDLINKLSNDKSYFKDFIDELTVNTTEMFRDPSFWSVIKNKVIPLFENHQTIRIWHAGCSSGEEVFTMSIILKELGLLDKAKIYASDLSKPILDKAKKGVYPLRNMEANAMNYELHGGNIEDFKKHYTIKNQTVVMDPSLIKNVQWVEQNLITTKTPFMKFDLILCRNVMIYFSSMLQADVFKLFHGSLLERGVIGIGSKESFIWNNQINSYEQLTNEEKIFRLL